MERARRPYSNNCSKPNRTLITTAITFHAINKTVVDQGPENPCDSAIQDAH